MEARDPYDPFRGRYVALKAANVSAISTGKYATFITDTKGFVTEIEWSDTQPQKKPYIENLDLNRYYMNEHLAPRAEEIQRMLEPEGEKMYLHIKTKNGNYVIEGLYLEGIAIEEIVSMEGLEF